MTQEELNKETQSKLNKEANEIEKYLEITTSTNPVELKKSAEISKTIIAIAKESHLSATVQNALLDRTCVHQIDAVRSLLSFEREGLRLNQTGY
jgi:hypothetical protein